MKPNYFVLSSILIITALIIIVVSLSWSLGKTHRENRALRLGSGISPGSMRSISQKPWIAELPSFLTPEECAHLIRLGEQMGMKQSKVGASTKDSYVDSKSRTSTTSFLRKGHDDIVKRIESKCSLVSCHPATHMEPLQIVKYSPGQFFREHHDYFKENELKDKNGKRKGPKYQRTITIFIYLNDLKDDEKGGSTSFPKAHPPIKIKPEMGKAVMFRNVSPANEIDELALHSGESVNFSTKYGCNVWMTSHPYSTHKE